MPPIANILEEIVAAKQAQIVTEAAEYPLEAVREAAAAETAATPPRPFAAALADNTRLPVIAEIKRRSPSKGVLCDPFDVAAIAAAYVAGGAACLSVLTDQTFFGGCDADLQTARATSGLPVLRKDFMLNEWQIFHSRAIGADAILLIVAILEQETLLHLAETAHALGMAVLVEVHDAEELQRALQLPPFILLGINNRNLKTFVTKVQTTLDLLPTVQKQWQHQQQQQKQLLVSESGIHSNAEVRRLQQAGVDAFLIGEALVQNPQPALAALFKSE